MAAPISHPVLADPLYPGFTEPEMTSRRAALEAEMAASGVEHLVVYSGSTGSSEIPWLTGWHITREAVALITPGEPIALLVQLYNHVANARILAPAADVQWGGPDTFATLAALLASRSPRSVGWIGDLPYRGFRRLSSLGVDLVDLSANYTSLRLVKSDEEIEWMRLGAAMTDTSLEALVSVLSPGVSEIGMAAAVEASYLADGGTNHLHFFAVTSMAAPTACVPSQWPTRRTVRPGDVVVTELSTSFWGYPGQLLRTLTVETRPTDLYLDLHAVADAALRSILGVVKAGVHVQDLVDAASLIDEAGYTIYDDLVHGFGGGYLPPVLGTRGRPNEPVPDMTLEEGMTIVVQPNIITPDRRAGVQTGELVMVTPRGFSRLHSAPGGLLQVP